MVVRKKYDQMHEFSVIGLVRMSEYYYKAFFEFNVRVFPWYLFQQVKVFLISHFV